MQAQACMTANELPSWFWSLTESGNQTKEAKGDMSEKDQKQIIDSRAQLFKANDVVS